MDLNNVQFTFEEKVVDFTFANLVEIQDGMKRMELVSKIIVGIAKRVVAEWTTKLLDQSEAYNRMQTLRSVWSTYALDQTKEINKLVEETDGDEKMLSKRMHELRKALKQQTITCQQQLNSLLAAVGDNNVKGALEAYSLQKCNVKFNKRVQELVIKLQMKLIPK